MEVRLTTKGERGGRPEVLAVGLCRCPGKVPVRGTLLAQLWETAVRDGSLWQQVPVSTARSVRVLGSSTLPELHVCVRES